MVRARRGRWRPHHPAHPRWHRGAAHGFGCFPAPIRAWTGVLRGGDARARASGASSNERPLIVGRLHPSADGLFMDWPLAGPWPVVRGGLYVNQSRSSSTREAPHHRGLSAHVSRTPPKLSPEVHLSRRGIISSMVTLRMSARSGLRPRVSHQEASATTPEAELRQTIPGRSSSLGASPPGKISLPASVTVPSRT